MASETTDNCCVAPAQQQKPDLRRKTTITTAICKLAKSKHLYRISILNTFILLTLINQIQLRVTSHSIETTIPTNTATITTTTTTTSDNLNGDSSSNSSNLTRTVATLHPLKTTTKQYNQVDFLLDQVSTALNIALPSATPTVTTITTSTSTKKPINLSTTQTTIASQATTTTTTTAASTKKTSDNLIEDDSNLTTTNKPISIATITSTNPITTTINPDFDYNSNNDQYDTSIRHDDDDVADCAFLSNDNEEEGSRLSNNERFIKLQNCIQGRIQQRLKASRRNGLELFESMNLSGGCAASLMNLMVGIGSLKSYAFKFMDASAKIPSGVMYGLLSDFGDFDQCLSIRSNVNVDIEHEAEEHEFSGKYCLINLRLNYHVDLEPNKTHLDGIIPDSLLWDDLIKNYWVSKSPKPFQMGMCVPSRCDQDDLNQLVAIFGRRFNSIVELQSCQDNFDLMKQHKADFVQTIILSLFASISVLTILGTFLDRYRPYFIYANTNSMVKQKQRQQANQLTLDLTTNHGNNIDNLNINRLRRPRNSISVSEFSRTSHDLGLRQLDEIRLWGQLLICFSLRRNWRIFIRKNAEDSLNGLNSPNLDHSFQTNEEITQTTTNFHKETKVLSPPSNNTYCNQKEKQNFQDSNSMIDKQFQFKNDAQQVDNVRKSVSAMDLNLSLDLPDCQDGKQMQSHSQQQMFITNDPLKAAMLMSNDKLKQMQLRQQLTIKIQANDQFYVPKQSVSLSHLSGLRLFVIVWITMGMSFLYPSANNYQYYRSIINMNITRNSVWFTSTNYTLGIDMLLYMTGLVFVYKSAQVNFSNLTFFKSPLSSTTTANLSPNSKRRIRLNSWAVLGLISKKILRFWPTYLTLIGMAICSPLLSNGPMWPEMVNKRLGEACRENWWSNVLFVNNFLKESEICLPSSWFVSVLMQLFIIGSIIIILIHKYSVHVAIFATSLLLILSCSFSFSFAYMVDLPAPVIRMDESFVMKINENIFRLYTNIFNNLGPFLIGMLGGLILIRSTFPENNEFNGQDECNLANVNRTKHGKKQSPKRTPTANDNRPNRLSIGYILTRLPIWPIILLMTIIVLSSVLHAHYTRFWSAIYWSLHRICWAICTGYLIHQCATYKWRLLHDILSLSSFIPISRLIFITYLVFPVFIHMHSGLVRDGLHVTIYNMTNVYVTRLVMATVTALSIHLLVELPFCSVEEILLNRWFDRINRKQAQSPTGDHSLHPLLVVAPFVSVPVQTPTNVSSSTTSPIDNLKSASRTSTPVLIA